MLLLVARLDPVHARLYPDLQEVHRFGVRTVELAVPYAAARAHALDVARTDRRAGADGVLVGQRSLEHVADDLHVPVTVRAEALAGLHPILVDHPQGAELDVLRIEIIGK